jgi:hypothetical protein
VRVRKKAVHVAVKMRLIGLVAVCLGVPQVLAAQQRQSEDPGTFGRIAGPVLGYVWDSAAGALRAIQGVPGSSLLGAPMDAGVPVARAAVSPRHDYVLAVTAEGEAAVLRIGGGRLARRLIEGVAVGAVRIALSPEGRAAALFYDGFETGRVQVVTGLPDQPALAGTLVMSEPPGALEALAVSDGGLVLAALAGAEGSTISLMTVEGEIRVIASAGQVSALAFAPGRADALAADRKSNQLLWIVAAAAAAAVRTLAGPDDGIAGPAAVAVSADGRHAVVANADSGTVAEFELEGAARVVVPCRCSPATLERLNGNAIFRLNEPSAGPMRLFDGDFAEPRVLFVPPVEAAAEESRQ